MSEVGEVYSTYAFATELQAKNAFEKVIKRCRGLSTNRWAMAERGVRNREAVTVLTEEGPNEAREFRKAEALLTRAGGKLIATPDWVLEPLRLKRARLIASGETFQLQRGVTGVVIRPPRRR